MTHIIVVSNDNAREIAVPLYWMFGAVCSYQFAAVCPGGYSS